MSVSKTTTITAFSIFTVMSYDINYCYKFTIYIISDNWIFVIRCHWWLKLEQEIYWLNTEPIKVIRLVSHFIKVYLCREKHFIFIMHVGMCFTGRVSCKAFFYWFKSQSCLSLHARFSTDLIWLACGLFVLMFDFDKASH